MSRKLKISEQLSLPLDFVTQACAILARRGAGKRLSLDTPIPTPDGWSTMRDLKVGDKVFDESGTPCKVTSISPIVIGNTFAVCFDDNTEIVADADHEWLTWDRKARRSAERDAKPIAESSFSLTRPQCQRKRVFPKVRSTTQILDTLRVNKKNEVNHSIKTTLPLQLPEIALPVHPYVLGVWLADGTVGRPTFTKDIADIEVVRLVESFGYKVNHNNPSSDQNYLWYISDIKSKLRDLGVLDRKHIPMQYLRASQEQRLWLLRGLLDTDGGWSGRQVEVAFSDQLLADDCFELIISLGMKATRDSRIPRLNGVECKRSYRTRFTPTMDVFSLQRKKSRLDFSCGQQNRRTHRYIIDVKKIKDVEMKCITVDSPNHLYLAGREMIPTHNSYTGSVLAEELIKNGMHVCIVDPIGVFWGIRSSGNGKSEGLPVVIFGGDHGDLPLDSTAGVLIADVVMNKKVTAVIDLSLMRKGEQDRFVCDFAERLYFKNRDPIHLIVDEADSFAPQKPQPGQQRMLGAMEDLVRRGRARGIGLTMVTQRSAVINKNLLSQTEVLICLQTTAPQDRDAVLHWVEAHGTEEQRKIMMDSLASLPVGTAWVWSPSWAKCFEKVRIRERETYDSSATPKVGVRRVEPKKLAPVEIESLKDQMMSLVKQKEADDPRTLKKRILELERQLASKPVAVKTEIKTQTITELHTPPKIAEDIERISSIAANIASELKRVSGEIKQFNAKRVKLQPLYDSQSVRRLPVADEHAKPVAASEKTSGDLGGGTRRILIALAQRPDGLTKKQIGVRAQLSSKSGTFTTYMGFLRSNDLVEGSEIIKISSKGIANLGNYNPLPTGEALKEYWRLNLGGGAGRMLEVLWSKNRQPITKGELAELAGISSSSGTFTTYLGKLRTLELVEGKSDALIASEELY